MDQKPTAMFTLNTNFVLEKILFFASSKKFAPRVKPFAEFLILHRGKMTIRKGIFNEFNLLEVKAMWKQQRM